jgi:hypothetical protein
VTQHTTEVLYYRSPFSGLYTDEQPRKTSLENIKHENTLTVPKALFRRESAVLNTRMYGNHDYQSAPLLWVSVHDSVFSWREHTHRPFWVFKNKCFGTQRTTNRGVLRRVGWKYRSHEWDVRAFVDRPPSFRHWEVGSSSFSRKVWGEKQIP